VELYQCVLLRRNLHNITTQANRVDHVENKLHLLDKERNALLSEAISGFLFLLSLTVSYGLQ